MIPATAYRDIAAITHITHHQHDSSVVRSVPMRWVDEDDFAGSAYVDGDV